MGGRENRSSTGSPREGLSDRGYWFVSKHGRHGQSGEECPVTATFLEHMPRAMGEARTKRRKLREIIASEPRCIYCLNAPTTIEHMPPISMFRARSRPNGMEFAACQDCNNRSSGADLVAAFLARLSQDERPEMLKEAGKLRDQMAKLAPGVIAEFFRPDKSHIGWYRTAGGIQRRMVKINMDGPMTRAYLTVFAAKFGMALYREHVGVALPMDGGVQLKCFLNAGLAQQTGDGILAKLPVLGTLQQGVFVVRDQFAYRYNCDGKSIVAALIGFNSNLHIFVVATSQPEFYNFPLFAPDFHFVRPGELTALIPKIPRLAGVDTQSES